MCLYLSACPLSACNPLNSNNLMLLQGLYQDRPKLPFVPGNEVSGVVIEVGRDVRTVSVGDAVRPLGLLHGQSQLCVGVQDTGE